MKKALLVAACVLGGPVWSQDAKSMVCEQVGKLAEQIMQIRQNEAPMSDVMKAIVPEDDGTGAAGVIKAVIMAAYAEPAMQSPDNQTQQVARFRNDVELQCFKGALSAP